MPVSWYCISLRSKYSLQQPVFKYPQVEVSVLMSETEFHTHTKHQIRFYFYVHCKVLRLIVSSGKVLANDEMEWMLKGVVLTFMKK
jgi:hypothetical protein